MAIAVTPAVAQVAQDAASTPTRARALASLRAVDDAEIQRRVERELQWHRQTLGQAYDEVGSRNPKWDAGVRQALELAAQAWGSDPARPGDLIDRVRALLDAAIAAGCDDPLVGYVYERFRDTYGRERLAPDDLAAAAEKLAASRYPAYRRARGLVAAAEAIRLRVRIAVPTPAAQAVQQRTSLLDRTTALLPEIAREATTPDSQLKGLARVLIAERQHLGATHADAYEAVASIVTRARSADAAVLPLIKGITLSDAAWQIRGTRYFEHVPDENYTRFQTLLAQASTALSEAMLRGATDQTVATDMMTIVLGLHGTDDAEMASWFDAARRAAPGSFDPYDRRLNSLLPRWGGSDEALLAFGRDAFKRREWGSRASLILVDVHDWIAKGPPAKTSYFAQRDVCAEIKSVYDAFLTRYPDAHRDRSAYANRLITCEAWRDADEQFRKLGEHADVTAFGGQPAYEARKAQVAIAARRGR